MNLHKVFAIFRKEILDLFRDWKTLIMMILVPLLMYPALFLIATTIQARGLQKMEQQKSRLAVQPGLPEGLLSMIRGNDKLTILSSEDFKTDMKEKRIEGYVGMTSKEGNSTYTIYYDGTAPKSTLAQQRLKDTMEKYLRQVQEDLISQHRIEVKILDPFFIKTENVASQGMMMGMLIGIMLPLLLITSMLMGTMYPAIDLIAGEKERGTMETILTTPVNKLELLGGKFLTVAASAFITGLLNLVSMMMTFSLSLAQFQLTDEGVSYSFSIPALLIIFLLIIPIALFISAVMMSASIFARNFKDAQNTVSPVFIILMLPTFAAMSPGMEINDILAMVPLTNVCLLFKEILMGNYPAQHIVTAVLSNSLLALISIIVASRLFNAEQILFAEEKSVSMTFSRARIREKDVFEPGTVLLILSVMILFMFYFGSLFQMKWGLWGIVPTEIILLFVPTIILIWFNKVDFKESLNLKGGTVLDLAGTITATVGMYILVIIISSFMTGDLEEALRFQETLIQMLKDVGPVWGFFIIAFLPAVCEEMVFRGITFSSLRKYMRPSWAIITTGILFGLFHLQFFRIIPTALIGIFLTYLVYRSGSIYMGMLGHLINNGLAVSMVFLAGSEVSVETPDTGSISLRLGLGLVLLVAGIGMMQKGEKGHSCL